jgi:uncharacterized repeat protein (TIGR03803 family)
MMKLICTTRAWAGVALLLATGGVSAASFTNLYIFSASNPDSKNNFTNSDGGNPDSIVVSGKLIYGAASIGGLHGDGTIFRVGTDGKHFTNLFNFYKGTFDPISGFYPDSTGEMPNPGLLLLNNTLYGTTFYGGVFGLGSVFKINTDGSGFSVLYSFAGTNGQAPSSGLTLFSNVLYGTTTGGGTNQSGTVFRMDLAGSSFAKIYDFTNDADTYGGLVVSSNALYGLARYGETGNGYVYRIGLSGGFSHVFDFDGTNASRPYSTPTLFGNTLFGLSFQGGSDGGGNVFRVDTDGQHYTNLFSFPRGGGANITGANPVDLAGLLFSGNVLYGTTSVSGSGGQGTVFQLNTDGSGFKVLHSFQYSDGAEPESLALSAGTLYGMSQGTSVGDGGVYALILAPSLTVTLPGAAAVLNWNDPSYFLYAAPTLTNTFVKITGAASPYTNSAAGTQRFFQIRPN